jgi:hypothetical protein
VAAPLLGAVEAAFDGVALPVGGDVETAWSPSARSHGLAPLNLFDRHDARTQIA